MKFTKDNISSIRKDITEALAPIEEKYGLRLKLNSITYSEDHFSAKLESYAFEKDEEGDKALFLRNAEIIKKKGYNFTELHYLKTFRGLDGKQYVLTGLRPNAKRNFCEIKDIYGTNIYHCSPEFIHISKR